MRKQWTSIVAAVALLGGLVAGCTPIENSEVPQAPSQESSAEGANEKPRPSSPEPAEPEREDPEPEVVSGAFNSQSGVSCVFGFHGDDSVKEFTCYLPAPTFETTNTIGEPVDCGRGSYVLHALIDSEMDMLCASEGTPQGLLVSPGKTEQYGVVSCSGVHKELECSFPYGLGRMGFEVSNDGYVMYLIDGETHSPGPLGEKTYFTPIPYREFD